MNIAEIRQKYPQYQNVDDETLASALHKKYYADKISIDDFKSKIGLQPQPMQQEKLLQAQPSDNMAMIPTEGYKAPTREQAIEQRKRSQANRDLHRFDDVKSFAYSIPVIGGGIGALQDIKNGIGGISARLADYVVGGNENSKQADEITRHEQDVYDASNKGGILDINPYGVNLNDVAGVATGMLGGGGAKALNVGNTAIQQGAKLLPKATGLLPKIISGAKNIGTGARDIALNATAGAITSPVLQERGQEGNQGEFAKQKAIQLGVGGGSGVVGAGLGKTIGALRRPSTAIKTSSQIKDLASQAFQLADEQGARIQPQETNSLIDRLSSLGSKSDLGKALNTSGKAEFVQETLNKFKDKNLSFKDVEELDKELTSIITDSFKEGRISADGYKIQKIQDELRDWVDNLDFSGNDKQGLQTLKTARSLYSQSMKLRDIESILQRADSMEQPTTAIKTGFRQLLNNPKRLRGYTDKEKDLIEKASKSGNVLDVVRSLGSRLNVITGIASGNPVQAGLSMAGSTASRGLGVKLQTNKALDVANEIASRNIDTTKPVNVIKKNLNPINSSVVATQSSRMTGQAMNAMTNKQDAQQQQTVKNKSINDYFKEYEADTTTKNKRMSDYFKEYEDKPQAQYQFKRPDFVNDTTQAESSGNPDAKSKTSTASGLGGFTDGTWNEMQKKYGKQYGLNNKADPNQQQIATDLLADDNAKYLKQRLKNRDISTKDLHVAHFMGAGGATRMILNIQRGQGDKLAYQTFRKEANANKPIFFDGRRPRTINEVYAVLASREK